MPSYLLPFSSEVYRVMHSDDLVFQTQRLVLHVVRSHVMITLRCAGVLMKEIVDPARTPPQGTRRFWPLAHLMLPHIKALLRFIIFICMNTSLI